MRTWKFHNKHQQHIMLVALQYDLLSLPDNVYYTFDECNRVTGIICYENMDEQTFYDIAKNLYYRYSRFTLRIF